MTKKHSFHIPVMGIGFTIDTPLKVSQYGMDSVISLIDDTLIEKLRQMYHGKYKIPYQEITEKNEDFRAKRITSYLNLLNNLAEKKIDELKNATSEKSHEIKEYFNMLADNSSIKQEFQNLTAKYFNLNEIRSWLKENLSMGSIDVNIMTKVDKDNYLNGEQLPVEYNDAHSALRGYANSDLNSSIVFSAGMNLRLYSYLAQFEDFYPDVNGYLKKKIILKVSDYRSALIQGKFLAKKGLWVSEYRIESGLNCGGHSFPTDGYLLGPVLAEFRDKREELAESMHQILVTMLGKKQRDIPEKRLPLKITAQGGVGTAEEHLFLLDHYKMDSVGWGTPFLLVPEVTNVDDDTMNRLMAAKEEDLYLSNISPLGVPFNTLRNNTKDIEKLDLIEKGTPGSFCPKKYVALNNEFNKKGLCTASSKYQKLKIEELQKEGLTGEAYQKKYDKIVEKSCLCVGLGTAALLVNNLNTDIEGTGVSICPGSSMAYFSNKMSLKNITDHIYGRKNVIDRTDRPNMFIQELQKYVDFITKEKDETANPMTHQRQKYLLTFVKNIEDGISYYQELFTDMKERFEDTKVNIIKSLDKNRKTLQQLLSEINKMPVILDAA